MGWFLVAAAAAGFTWYVLRDDQRLGWMARAAPTVPLAVGVAAWVGTNRAAQHTREQVAAQCQLGWSEGWTGSVTAPSASTVPTTCPARPSRQAAGSPGRGSDVGQAARKCRTRHIP